MKEFDYLLSILIENKKSFSTNIAHIFESYIKFHS